MFTPDVQEIEYRLKTFEIRIDEFLAMNEGSPVFEDVADMIPEEISSGQRAAHPVAFPVYRTPMK